MAAVLDCAACGSIGRAGLLAAAAAALCSGGIRLLPLPGVGAVRGLRRSGDAWQARFDAGWVGVSVPRAVEVLRGGWWLQLRCSAPARSHWVWIDAGRTPRAPYRALCRTLRQGEGRSVRDSARGPAAAGRTSGAAGTDPPRRASRPDEPSQR